MADKKVYFFKARLFDQSGKMEYSYKIIPEIFKELLDNPYITKTVDNIKVLDITENGEKLHTTLDVFRYEEDHLFLRAARQKPNFSTIVRKYSTGEATQVLPGEKDDEKGIENYTYIYMDYEYGILSVVRAQGAPDEDAIVMAFVKYSNNYSLHLEAVPNPKGIERIYNKNNTQISAVNICIPTADPVIVEQILGKKGRKLFQETSTENLQISIHISSKIKKGKVTDNSEDSEYLVNCMKEKQGDFKSASVTAKYTGEKSREYNLYDEMFYFPITISLTQIVDGKTEYFTSDDLVQIYHDQLKIAYNRSKGYLIQITNRNKEEG